MVLLILHTLFFVLSMNLDGIRIPDSYDYIYQAQNLQEKGSLYAWTFEEELKPDYFTKRTPAYAVFRVILGQQDWLVLLLQNLLSILVFMRIYEVIIKRLGNAKLAFWVPLVFLVLQSNQLIYANTLISEVLFQYFLFLGLSELLLHRREIPFRNFLLVGLLFSIALFIKPVLLFFWVPFLVLSLYLAVYRRIWKFILPALFMPALIWMWSAHNQALTGWFHYCSISTVNLKDYNTRLTLEAKYGVEEADKQIAAIQALGEAQGSYAERNKVVKDTCAAIIKSELDTYAKVHFKGMLAMLLDPGRYDYVNFFQIKEGESGLMYLLARGDIAGMWQLLKSQSRLVNFFFFLNLFGSVVLLCMALTGLWTLRKELYVFLVIGGFAAYFWVLTGPVGTARYKSALLPLMLVLAAAGIQFWFTRLKAKKAES